MFTFGVGRGHLTQKVVKIAAKHGADAINYTDPGCSCGKGCAKNCPSNRRHWFEIENRGEPFNSRQAKEVLQAVEQAR